MARLKTLRQRLRLPGKPAAPRPDLPLQQRLRRGAWLGALLGALICLVLQAPAAWLAGVVASASQGRVQLAEAEGTLWNGSAVTVLTAGSGSRDARALPGRLEWTLRPQGLSWQLRLRQACCLNGWTELRLRPGLGRVRAELIPGGAWLGLWPAAWLSGLGTPWNTLQPSGGLRLSTRNLTFEWVQGRFAVEGSADLELVDFASRLSTLPRLGSYRLSLSGDRAQAGTLQVQLSTLDGALLLSGQGSWSASGFRLRGEASAAEADQAALNNLLNIIGRRDGARSIISIG
ncbi:MAG: hypothetical protein RJA44_1654 [Pseudomonadota bacterium]|jgi:general secretion pathway protein N